MSSQTDLVVRALRRLITKDPEKPIRIDAETLGAVARGVESRLLAAARLAVAPFVELLRPLAASAPASEAPAGGLGAFAGWLARHRQVLSLAGCGLVVAVAAVFALPPVSAAESPLVPDGSAEPSAFMPQPEVAFYQPDGMIYNTIQLGDGPAGSGGYQWYTVVGGDTVAKIASRFHISIETLYWANKNRLPNLDSISIGLRLLIPPVDGITMVVTAEDTLGSLAKKYKTSTQEIMIANSLPDENITPKQILVMPVDPPALPVVRKPSCVGNCSYTGGTLLVPVKGYYRISQYYSSSHPAIDFAAATGTPVIAAAGGKVIYAGWKTSGGGQGGGIVVWIDHNGKLYTTYNHLSAEFVSVGQTIAAGQRIGSVGETGMATGPHLHFEVWVCYPWTNGNTGCARNPLSYLP